MVFGSSGLSAGFLTLLLPETLNKPTAESIEDFQSPKYQVLKNRKAELIFFFFYCSFALFSPLSYASHDLVHIA